MLCIPTIFHSLSFIVKGHELENWIFLQTHCNPALPVSLASVSCCCLHVIGTLCKVGTAAFCNASQTAAKLPHAAAFAQLYTIRTGCLNALLNMLTQFYRTPCCQVFFCAAALAKCRLLSKKSGEIFPNESINSFFMT